MRNALPLAGFDHEVEVLESYVTKRRNRASAPKYTKKAMKRYGQPEVVITGKLRSKGTATKVIGNTTRQKNGVGRIIDQKITAVHPSVFNHIN